MKTKTPKQISDQTLKLMDAIGNKHWNGKKYVNHSAMMAKLDYVMAVCKRYLDNIYKLNGVDDRFCSAEVSNKLWNTAATPASVYMK